MGWKMEEIIIKIIFQVYQTGGTTQGRKFKMTAEQIQKELGLKIP